MFERGLKSFSLVFSRSLSFSISLSLSLSFLSLDHNKTQKQVRGHDSSKAAGNPRVPPTTRGKRGTHRAAIIG